MASTNFTMPAAVVLVPFTATAFERPVASLPRSHLDLGTRSFFSKILENRITLRAAAAAATTRWTRSRYCQPDSETCLRNCERLRAGQEHSFWICWVLVKILSFDAKVKKKKERRQ